jgi:hypothetical protein
MVEETRFDDKLLLVVVVSAFSKVATFAALFTNSPQMALRVVFVGVFRQTSARGETFPAMAPETVLDGRVDFSLMPISVTPVGELLATIWARKPGGTYAGFDILKIHIWRVTRLTLD